MHEKATEYLNSKYFSANSVAVNLQILTLTGAHTEQVLHRQKFHASLPSYMFFPVNIIVFSSPGHFDNFCSSFKTEIQKGSECQIEQVRAYPVNQ